MAYDCAIIGTGPAGVSAALTLKANDKNFVLIGSKNFSDKVGKAELIANYPGLSKVTGKEMNEAFRKQLDELGIEIQDQMVNQIMSFGGNYALMAGSEFFEAKTVIITTGVTAVGTVPGEEALLGRGVSYCATCDGALYRGKTIAVICNAKRLEHEVEFLADLAEKVYYLPTFKDSGIKKDNVEFVSEKAVEMLSQDGKFCGLKLKSGEVIEANGVFCLRDSVSLGTMIPGLEVEQGRIVVDRGMHTNLPGVFAAGDCTGRPYQYVKAAGEGNVAAHSVVEYLAENK